MHLIGELVRRLTQTATLVGSTYYEHLAYLAVIQFVAAIGCYGKEVVAASSILTEDEVAESLRLCIP